jgi:beta-xylosidase
MARDMTLFVDDDGKAYHIYSSEENSTLHISLLTDDYLSPSGKYARVFVNRFMEAPTIFKKDGKYYMINSGCTGWAPNEGRSAVAESIWGPWTELGNPFKGKDSEISLNSQGTFILKVPGMKDAFIYIGDRWVPDNPVDGTSVWLPLKFSGGSPVIEWVDKWDLGYFSD